MLEITTDSAEPQAISFGTEENLVGVYQPATTRTHAPADHPRSAVVIVTAGMLHSAGPYRMHVAIADRLAVSGIASLRFDLSGIGESLPGTDLRTSLDRASREIGEALTWLTKSTGCQDAGVFGLCSGADDALHAAVHDDRIRAVYAMDGCGFATPRFHWNRIKNRYLSKVTSVAKWSELASRALGARPSARTMPMGFDIREFPPREDAEQDLLTLSQRGARVHMLYTGGVEQYYNYADQFEDMFPGVAANAEAKQLITSSFRPEFDHTAFLTEHRSQLAEMVAAFFEAALPLKAASGSSTAVGICIPELTNCGAESGHGVAL